MQKVISFDNGLNFEIEISETDVVEISSARSIPFPIDNLSKTFDQITRPLNKVISDLGDKFQVEETEIKFGIKFGVEGNVIVAKGKGEANIGVTMKVKKK